MTQPTQTHTSERHALALAAAVAMRSLSLQAKTDRDHRRAIYRLKARLLAALWRDGLCIAAEVHRLPAPGSRGNRVHIPASGGDEPGRGTHAGLWHFVFAVAGYRFSWHLPAHEVSFEAVPFQGPPQRLQHLVVDQIDPYEARMAAVRAYLAAVGG